MRLLKNHTSSYKKHISRYHKNISKDPKKISKHLKNIPKYIKAIKHLAKKLYKTTNYSVAGFHILCDKLVYNCDDLGYHFIERCILGSTSLKSIFIKNFARILNGAPRCVRCA